MSYEIAFISPYKKMGELFSEICQEFNKEIIIKVGDLEEGARQAVELEEQGVVDVIISRGGTAIAIKEKVTALPVVEVQISGFDLIRALHQVRQETSRVAVVGFSPFTYGIEDLGDIMGLNLKVITLDENWYEHPLYVEKQLKEIKLQGYNWVVGDNISVKVAKKLGMNALLIKSGKEALMQSILEAERVAEVRKKELEKTKRIKSIIDFAYEGIITVDQKGVIDTFNPQAAKIFKKETYKIIGENINKIFPGFNFSKIIKIGQKIEGKIWTIGDIKIVANIIPIKINNEIVRTVVTFQKVSQVQKIEQKIREKLYLKGNVAENTFSDIIGRSQIFRNLKEEAKNYALVDSPVLLYGETGTGKELFAQAIHNCSPRRNKSFVAFNCAALPESLLESELFGYVEGAFTGAKKVGKMGLFEQAHEGTIFLDEIGEISQNIQARLLRVLQERKIRRLGDDRVIPVDVRVIASTNKKLIQLVKENKFRDDLYYRINVLNLEIPPLREREKDISLLVNFFIKKHGYKFKKIVVGISEEGMQILENYDWPGNIRQLENIIERLIIRAKDDYIMTNLVKEVMKFPDDDKTIYVDRHNLINRDNRDESNLYVALTGKLEDIERVIIEKMIENEKGNKTIVATKLGIGRTTLWRKMQENN
ncbi:MAG: sigma 54-interacting transcriptional regulator [Candidatus Atribacteria bacterium]|nr:sigma 54-interacting transcriptional regulator [Candidatus Atribacteria bacterium]